jgi:3',5'-cyclic AMP phosphodiesterase CpdA
MSMKIIHLHLLASVLLAVLVCPAGALDWTQEAFPDDDWIYDRAEFGFGDGDETTELPQGWTTYYFRYSFPAEPLENAYSMTLEVNYDDAFAAYINGVEVARSANLPAGPLTHSTLALWDHEGGSFVSYDLTWLVNENPWEYVTEYFLNLSVEVHQVSPADDDLTLAVRLLIDGLPKIYHNSKGLYWFDDLRPAELITDPITTIYRPLINIPTIVERGQSFQVTCGAPSATTNWQAQLSSSYAHTDLALSSIQYDAARYRWLLQASVPGHVPMGLYDLVVTASGGIRDTTTQSVKVIQGAKQDFYFIHLTDTHIPERGNGTLHLLDEIIQEANIINPEFVLISGDYVNRSYKDQIEIGQLYLEKFKVPVYLTSGNHDVGDGMEPWWEYFGWPYLNYYDPAHWDNGPVTQDYSFDYGNLHVVAPMTWVNYIYFQYWIYGYHSMISTQFDWLHQDLSSAKGDPYLVMFYHYDFGWYDDAPQMPQFFTQYEVDLALWGHTHQEAEYQDGSTLSLNTAAAQHSSGGFRMLKFADGQLVAHPHLWNPDNITLDLSLPNDGTSTSNTATIVNTHDVVFENALVSFEMLSPGDYQVAGGEILQVIDAGDRLIYEVETEVPANGQRVVYIDPLVGVNDEGPQTRPGQFVLHQNSPNPFNASTNISFTMLGDRTQRVTLQVYNVRGQEVITLLDQRLPPGRHMVRWDGCDRSGRHLASGLYFCRLRAGQRAKTVKSMLLR